MSLRDPNTFRSCGDLPICGWKAVAMQASPAYIVPRQSPLPITLQSPISRTTLIQQRKRRPPWPSQDPTGHPISKPQTPPHVRPNSLLILRPPLPPHPSGINIRRTLIIRLSKHRHDGYEDLLDRLDGTPAFGGFLVVIRIIARGVKDGDADEAGWVDCSIS